MRGGGKGRGVARSNGWEGSKSFLNCSRLVTVAAVVVDVIITLLLLFSRCIIGILVVLLPLRDIFFFLSFFLFNTPSYCDVPF